MTFEKRYYELLDAVAKRSKKPKPQWWDGHLYDGWASEHLSPEGLALRRLTRRLSWAARCKMSMDKARRCTGL